MHAASASPLTKALILMSAVQREYLLKERERSKLAIPHFVWPQANDAFPVFFSKRLGVKAKKLVLKIDAVGMNSFV